MTVRASRPLVPLASALLLFLFAAAYRVFAGAMVPWLLDLWDRSPRLATLSWLALLASPVGFVAAAHRAVHRGMARLDGEAVPRFTSLRQGFFAWFAMSFASMASGLLLLFLFPPPPDEDVLSVLVRTAADVRLEAGVHTVLWIATAALLYHVDRTATERR